MAYYLRQPRLTPRAADVLRPKMLHAFERAAARFAAPRTSAETATIVHDCSRPAVGGHVGMTGPVAFTRAEWVAWLREQLVRTRQ